MGLWNRLFNGESHEAGMEAQYEWQAHLDGVDSADVPESVVRRMAEQAGEDPEEFLEGWRAGDQIDEKMEKVVDWWVRLFG